MALSESTDRFHGLRSTLAIKAPCAAVAVANITLDGEQTVNGVAVVAGDRVLVIAQTNAVDNGIYDVSSSAWTRSADFDGNRDVVNGTFVTVATATVGRNPYYQITTANPITIGNTEINFTLADGPNVSFDLTPAEITAGLTDNDIDKSFEPATVLRYGENTIPDTTDMTVPIRNAVKVGFYSGSETFFQPGIYKITSPAVVADATIFHRLLLRGTGAHLNAAVIKPYSCAVFEFDGNNATGGFCFDIAIRDLHIDASQASPDAGTPIEALLLFDNTYRITLDNIWIREAVVSSTRVHKIIETKRSCLVNYFSRIGCYGQGNTGTGYGFYLGHTIGNLVLEAPDPENLWTGIYCGEDTQVDINSPFIERQGIGIYIQRATANGMKVNIRGGNIELPSASSSGIFLNGTFANDEQINIDGVKFRSNDHATKKTAFNINAMTWNNAGKIAINALDWSWISTPAGLDDAAVITPHDPYNIRALKRVERSFQLTGLADNVATDIFKLDGFDTVSPYPPVYVKIKAFVSHNGFGRAIEESVFVIQDRSDQNAFISTKQIIAEVRENDSANFSITTFLMLAIENTSDITFQITSDFNNSIISTINPYFEVTIIGNATFTAL